MVQSAITFLQLVDKDKHFSNSHKAHRLFRRKSFEVS